jgi:hypothetical protein
MKKWLFIFLCFFTIACNENETEYPNAENALDAGREFVDGCLKGNFDKARAYMLPDDKNIDLLNNLEIDFNRKSKEDRNLYKDASINIDGVEELNDSTTIINYRNSYDKIARKLKVVKENKEKDWWVDFKYTFSGNL